MRYTARTPIKYRDDSKQERTIAPGRTVPDHLVDDGLIACGAIEADGEEEDGDSGVDAPGKPLAKMSRAELDVILSDEEIDIGSAKTNKEIVKLIETARAAKSGSEG